MAEAAFVNEPKCRLLLTLNEAKLIKLLTQNCLHAAPGDEPPLEKQAREAIFNALKDAGVE